MPSTRTTRLLAPSSFAPALALVLLAGGALSGCGGSSNDDAGASTPTPSSAAPSTPTPPPSESVTPSPTSSATSTTPSPSATTTRAAGAALLSAAELPKLDASTAWTQGTTGPAGSDAFGLCQKFDLLTIGAERAVQRTFTSGSGSTGGQQVADFPDAQNTVRAGSVLEAWHRDCAGRVQGTQVQVGAIAPVSTSSGRGWWYLVRYERGGQRHVHTFGVVLSGSRMTLLSIDTTGQGRTYPTGQDPMQLAVKAAAAKLV